MSSFHNADALISSPRGSWYKASLAISLAMTASSILEILDIGAGIPSIAFGGLTNPSLRGD